MSLQIWESSAQRKFYTRTGTRRHVFFLAQDDAPVEPDGVSGALK
jgi:hypothetical protein